MPWQSIDLVVLVSLDPIRGSQSVDINYGAKVRVMTAKCMLYIIARLVDGLRCSRNWRRRRAPSKEDHVFVLRHVSVLERSEHAFHFDVTLMSISSINHAQTYPIQVITISCTQIAAVFLRTPSIV